MAIMKIHLVPSILSAIKVPIGQRARWREHDHRSFRFTIVVLWVWTPCARYCQWATRSQQSMLSNSLLICTMPATYLLLCLHLQIAHAWISCSCTNTRKAYTLQALNAAIFHCLSCISLDVALF